MDSKKYRLRVIVVVAGLLFVSFSYYAYQIFYTANIQVNKEDSHLYIYPGATFEVVLDSLRQKEALSDVVSFAFLSKLLGYRDEVKPGRYLLRKNSSNLDLLKRLKRGGEDPVNLTFNNIRTLPEFAGKISARMMFDSNEFISAITNKARLDKLGYSEQTIMAMFIPNTYQLYWTTSPTDFIDRMKNENERFWNAERKSKATKIGLTPVQVMTMASIVEAETNQDKERATIAGVYMNRYNTGMKLQADPTVKFAVGDFSLKRINNTHTSLESPYNTYKNVGLPPGPINLPSITSIDAVLNYERHKYFYFCASPEAIGFHDFAETFNDHVKNAQKYRDYLDKLNIH
ncbi:MAG: endolytic transglycosylase MltG [Cytophagaceae bacterium]|jgi:UPF0755 protein|nr:endolytic transglycosylase MltG [Cytophagaceae bacterium]